MKAKTILDAEKKDAIDIATELCYSLEEFRKALSSDATEENAQLKRQLSDLQTEYHEKLSKLENENDSLKESCRVLCNRCFTLTRGVTCLLRKEIEKNG